jgi:hypothetical protein
VQAIVRLMLEISALLVVLAKPKRTSKKAGKRIPSEVQDELRELREALEKLQRRIAK